MVIDKIDCINQRDLHSTSLNRTRDGPSLSGAGSQTGNLRYHHFYLTELGRGKLLSREGIILANINGFLLAVIFYPNNQCDIIRGLFYIYFLHGRVHAKKIQDTSFFLFSLKSYSLYD